MTRRVSDHAEPTKADFDIVGIAASAGGIHAIGAILSALPANFAAPVVVVQHLCSLATRSSRPPARSSSFSLEIGLPLDPLKAMIKACLASEDGERQSVVEAVNRLGKKIRCRVSCEEFQAGPDAGDRGVVLMMEEVAGA